MWQHCFNMGVSALGAQLGLCSASMSLRLRVLGRDLFISMFGELTNESLCIFCPMGPVYRVSSGVAQLSF